MHDSLPMVLFRFEILLKLYEAEQFAWVAYFFPWVLLNEAMSHKNVRSVDRLGWLRLAYCSLMKCNETYRSASLGPGVTAFGRRNSPEAAPRTLFDKKMVMHATNTIAAIIFEIHHATHPISLERISTIPLEKRFGVTRMHAGTHQTMFGILKAMEIDQGMKFVYAQREVKNRRFAYGEIVDPCDDKHPFDRDPLLYAEVLLSFIGFPMSVNYPVIMQEAEVIRGYVEELFSDVLLPFAKTNLSAMSNRKRRSLFQELAGVTPSSRRIMLSSKSQTKRVLAGQEIDPVERHIVGLLGRTRVLSEELRLVIEQVCEAATVSFEGPHRLNRSTKREMLDWISANWEELGQVVTSITANQRTLPSLRRERPTTMK
jgi:hypothetical protein